MVKHGALSKSHVYQLLRSKDARVRRAAFTLLETSNPRLRRNSELFIEITRFIWDANPSYEVYQEFTKGSRRSLNLRIGIKGAPVISLFERATGASKCSKCFD
jgi:predicted HD phosphohydrolase